MTSPDAEPLPIISGPNFTAVIFPAYEASPGSWTPTEAQVIEAEPTVQRCVVAKRPDLAAILHRYARQYSGFMQGHRRELRVAFFDTRYHSLEHLRNAFVIIDDAGDDYFELVYEPTSQECLRLSLK